MSMHNIKDYYYILGLNKNASKDEIKKAYRKLSLKFHPDQNAGDKFFEERFKDVNEAYEILIDDAKRKLYDDKLRGANDTGASQTYDSAAKTTSPQTESTNRTSAPPPQKPVSIKKKRSNEIIYTLIAIVVFITPFILKNIAGRLERKESSGSYGGDTSYSSQTGTTDTSTATLMNTGSGSLDSAVSQSSSGATSDTAENTNQQTDFKDDAGLAAEDVLNHFFQAFNDSDCNAAWYMTYNRTWIESGKDWFCSSNAFGGVRKISIHTMYALTKSDTETEIYADYYAEDIYNGNKCFKQDITLQKINYTDNKQRWTITEMKNIEAPVACSEN